MARDIHCKYCDTFLKDYDHYASHIEKHHSDYILPGMDSWQFIFYFPS